MKKIMSLLLAVVLVLSLAACGGETKPTDPTTVPTTAPTTAPTTEPTTEPTTDPTAGTQGSEGSEGTEPVVTEKAVSSFSMSVMKNYEPVITLFISDNGDGTVYVEYMNEVRKLSYAFDGAAMDTVVAALEGVDLDSLGEGVYEEGIEAWSLSISYDDFSYFMYDASGEEMPAAYEAILTVMDAAFQTALADLEIYVPEMMVMGSVDADILDAGKEIMNNSGIQNLENMAVSEIALDENFAFTAGLSGTEGIVAGASCGPMMSSIPFSLIIVSAESDAVSSVAADFETSMNWDKWGCVRASNAMIATKGNLVLCLMASDAQYTGTASAIENAGWTVVTTLVDPLG